MLWNASFVKVVEKIFSIIKFFFLNIIEFNDLVQLKHTRI
jgi:hypothetical protein